MMTDEEREEVIKEILEERGYRLDASGEIVEIEEDVPEGYIIVR